MQCPVTAMLNSRRTPPAHDRVARFDPPRENAPSWVALDDIKRQIGHVNQVTRDLAPFRGRIRASHGLYLMTESRIDDEDHTVWRQMRGEVTLVRAFGDESVRVRQIAAH